MTKAKQLKRKLEILRSGAEPTVNLQAELADERPGDIPGPDVRAILRLARALQAYRDPDYVVVSWDSQVEAESFFNTHGLGATLDEIVRLGGVL